MYKIIEAIRIDELEIIVNDYIRLGWQPLGSPFVDRGNYFQAMIK